MSYAQLMYLHLATVLPAALVGAILIAGGFTLAPDRYLHDLLFVDGLSARP
jgi:hypothetical protein